MTHAVILCLSLFYVFHMVDQSLIHFQAFFSVCEMNGKAKL